MSSRKFITCSILLLLSILAIVTCKPGEKKETSFLAGKVWKLNTVRTGLPQWMVQWDSTGFEREINEQYFETLTFSDDGRVVLRRYLDVPDRESGQYAYEAGKWAYSNEMEVLLLDLKAQHRQEGDTMKYKAEYQLDRISEDTLRLTRIRVIAKEGDFRDH